MSQENSIYKWKIPNKENNVELTLYNSLTRQKEPFVPKNGNKVLWYTCGPTVYDASHMGHARSYISFDIIRRVLQSYFNYNVLYVMNITDIDDKIIKRARQNYRFKMYVQENPSLDQMFDDCIKALEFFSKKLKSDSNAEAKTLENNVGRKINEGIKRLQNMVNTNSQVESIQNEKQAFLNQISDVLGDWLDAQHRYPIEDHSIFLDLPRYWEEAYHQDMSDLNILPPNCLTRVTEYIPEIITFISKIITNGYAYVSKSGSVYFDTMKFDKAPNHHYAKLLPEAFGDQKALNEGEGELSISEDKMLEKKNKNDFALWKATKPEEIFWDSPWGKGRPGWHIECSVMATSICGSYLDIHAGGIDLKFPHHDNEIAQTEAFYENDDWVNYFLHSGHLTIEGCKMSKSLKNFVTIKDALRDFTAQQLRFTFLLHSWKDSLDYSSNTMANALHYEKMLNEFFLNAKDLLRKLPKGTFSKWNSHDELLNKKFIETKAHVHQHLCDSIDTKSCLDDIKELINFVYIYQKNVLQSSQPNYILIKDICLYITYLFKTFGIYDNDEIIGPSASNMTVGGEEAIMPYLEIIATFRDKVRTSAINNKNAEILLMCDDLRDNTLPNLGVRLEDKGEVPVIKYVGTEVLAKERDQREVWKQAKELEKLRIKEQNEQNMLKKEQLSKIPPEELFKGETDKYSKFDDLGLPTHDIQGEPLSKSQYKKLQKIYQNQVKKYNDYAQKGF